MTKRRKFFTILTLILYDISTISLFFALAYIQRGYFAIGGEIFPSLLLLIGSIYFIIATVKSTPGTIDKVDKVDKNGSNKK